MAKKKPPSERLQAWRQDRKLTQKEAAALLDPPIHQTHWGDLERAASAPRLDLALRLAHLTGIPAEEWAE